MGAGTWPWPERAQPWIIPRLTVAANPEWLGLNLDFERACSTEIMYLLTWNVKSNPWSESLRKLATPETQRHRLFDLARTHG